MITLQDKVNTLTLHLSKMDGVDTIAISKPLTHKKPDGDIDLFVYCDYILTASIRKNHYPGFIVHDTSFRSEIFDSEKWGKGDFVSIDGVETWIMYFTKNDVLKDLDSILNGRQIKNDNGYYPLGRLSMFKHMVILYEKSGFVESIKESICEYPETLRNTVIKTCADSLDDTEDLQRACERKDILFYHVSIDAAIDTLLQLVFAINKEYFPSRKRSQEYLKRFAKVPKKMYERLCKIVRLGTNKNTIKKAFILYEKLAKEVQDLIQ